MDKTICANVQYAEIFSAQKRVVDNLSPIVILGSNNKRSFRESIACRIWAEQKALYDRTASVDQCIYVDIYTVGAGGRYAKYAHIPFEYREALKCTIRCADDNIPIVRNWKAPDEPIYDKAIRKKLHNV